MYYTAAKRQDNFMVASYLINGAQTFEVEVKLPSGERKWVKSDLTHSGWDNSAPGAGLDLFYIALQVLEDYPGSKILAVSTAGKL